MDKGMAQTQKISLDWSISASGTRTAQVGDVILGVGFAVKGQDLPWMVVSTSGSDRQVVAQGYTRYAVDARPNRDRSVPGQQYSSQVRQAMFEVEQAAAALGVEIGSAK